MPPLASFLERLASFSRVVVFDKRGTGLSDPVAISALPSLEDRMDDLRVVMDEIGLEIRAGVHTGEVELVGGDVRGIAVHIGARVAAMAGAGEVLVSSIVRDLVARSGIEFEDRGMYPLKGVPGAWRVLAATGA